MRGIKPDYNKFNPQPKPDKKEKLPYKGINKISDKAKAKKDEKRQLAVELDKFCKEFYEQHPTKTCHECGGKIWSHYKLNYHHIIPKKDADLYTIDIILNQDNLVLLDKTCHSKVEVNIDHAPKVKELTKIVKAEFEKYLI